MLKIAGNIVFEITRRCNMNCQHCLRGDAQNLDMSKKTADAVLDQVDYIYTINFTGGEPGLNVEMLRYILDGCKMRKIPVYDFYIVTNGKKLTVDFLMALLEWNAYCIQCGGGDNSAVALSLDEFHESIPQDNIGLLKGLAFFNGGDKNSDYQKLPLINEGKAMELGGQYAKRELNHYDPVAEIDEGNPESVYVNGVVYFCADGTIRTECDAAYENTKYDIGNIHTCGSVAQLFTDKFPDN